MLEKLEDNSNSEALAWLLEMELVSNPYVLNSIILNMLVGIKGVKDTELVIDEKQKKILIYLELTWFSAKFNKIKIEQKVNEMIGQILPSFKKRIIFDRTILEKALKLVAGK